MVAPQSNPALAPQHQGHRRHFRTKFSIPDRVAALQPVPGSCFSAVLPLVSVETCLLYTSPSPRD
eukprot:15422363-Alexandrium_andersonii.AAC.1